MIDLSYAYANTRVKGMKSKLLGGETLRALFSCSTLAQFVELLENTHYRQAFVEASTRFSGMKLVMAALRLEFDVSLASVLGVVGINEKGNVESLIARWQLKHVQAILASKASSLPLEDTYLDFLDEKGRAKIAPVLAASTFEDALAALPAAGYGEISAQTLAEYQRTRDFRSALRRVDRHYYELLSGLVAKEHADRELRLILESELDFYNQTAALRLKGAGAAPQRIMEEIIGEAEPSGAEQAIANSASVFEAVEALQERLGIQGLSEAYAASRSLADVELLLEKRMFEKILSATRVSVLSLGTVLGYIYLKRREIENLRTIAISLLFPGRKDQLRKSVYSMRGVGA